MTRYLTLLAILVVHATARSEDSGLVRVVGDGSTRLFQRDGTLVKSITGTQPHGVVSPDGKRRAYVTGGDEALWLADGDGKAARRLTPDNMTAGSSAWSPDGKQLAFLARPYAAPGTFQAAHWQLHTIDADGKNLAPHAPAPAGAGLPKFAPDGRLSHQRYYPREGKIQRSDLIVGSGDDAKTIVKNVYLIDYAWSPAAKHIVYSQPGAIVFHELATDKALTIVLTDIHSQMRGHAAWNLTFSPDGEAVACTIGFFGGRQARGPKIFGDDELFIVPRSGKPTWFEPGIAVRGLEWTK